jgi:hypothetical protein
MIADLLGASRSITQTLKRTTNEANIAIATFDILVKGTMNGKKLDGRYITTGNFEKQNGQGRSVGYFAQGALTVAGWAFFIECATALCMALR